MARCKQLGLEYDCGADGIVNTRVAFVGEHPGERERSLKMPLVGSSGQLLWNTLRPHGINRRSAYITNVVKRQPLGDRSEKTKEKFNAGEVSHYTSILLWELNQLPDLSVVVVLGNLALQAVTGHSGITSYRGSVFDVQLPNAVEGCTPKTVKVIALLNPAAILREPKNELMFRFDCDRLNSVLNGTFEEYNVECIINPSFDEAMAWIDKMESDGLPVGRDIETSSGETICVGLANDPHVGMCINFRNAVGNRFTVREEMQLWKRLQRLFTNPDVRFVGQNWMYDASWMWFIDRVNAVQNWFDTMLAHHTLYPIMPHNLGFLTTQYTTHPFYKDEGKSWRDGGDIDSHWRYNVKDCCIMLKCQQLMLKELEAQGMADFFFSHVMPLQPELIDMVVHGVKIDRVLKDQIAVEMKIEVARLREEFVQLARACTGQGDDYKPNPNSAPQLADLFFKRLRLVGRGVTTNEENRRRMREHPRTPDDCKQLLTLIDEYKKEQKFQSTYAEMTIDEDGRIRTEYKQMGVIRAPGRLSSGSTGWGTGCMPTTAQAYTPNGWISISERPEQIAQYNAAGYLEFVPAHWNFYEHNGTLKGYGGRCFRGLFTDNHRIIATKRDRLYELPAENAFYTSGLSVPCTGLLVAGKSVNALWLRKWVMLSADGHFNASNKWEISVKKRHKAERIAKLLGTAVPEQDTRGYYRWRTIEDEGFTKSLEEVLSLDLAARQVVLDELQYWDAHRRGKSYIYYTTLPENAHAIHTCAHISGMTASLVIDETNSNEYGNTATKPLYSVNVSAKQTNFVEEHRWFEEEFVGEVGCPTVPNGMWLVRYDGGIHITGNSNLQNQPERSHKMFVADDGYEFSYFDLAQAEARYVGWKAVIPLWIEQYEQARLVGGYDAHRALAAVLFNVTYDSVPTKDWDENGKPTIRYKAKRCRHAMNYRMMPDRLATELQISYAEAEYLWHLYHKANPEIQEWWEYTCAKVKKDQVLFNAYGRRWMLMEKYSDEATESIIAFDPQSSIGDKVTRTIRLCHNDRDWPRKQARICLNIHDALIALHHRSVGEEVRHVMKKHLEEPIPVMGNDGVLRELIIPADAKVSVPDEFGRHRWSGMEKVIV